MGEAYRDLANRPLSAEQLAGIPLLLLSSGSSTRRFVEQWFAAKGLTIEADIELGSIDLLVEFAKLGFGAAFMTRSFVMEELNSKELFELNTVDLIPPRSIGIAVRRDIRLSLTAERFVKMLTT